MRGALVCLALAASCGPTPGGRTELLAHGRQAIVGGHVDFGDPQVFMLLIDEPGGQYLCSSTLIGPRTLLTAAHCVVSDDGSPVTVSAANAPSFFAAPKASRINALQAIANENYDATTITNDTGIVQLEREPFVPVKALNRSPAAVQVGVPLRIVGFGITAPGSEDYGLKRVTTSAIQGVSQGGLQVASKGHGICSGDSGGPAFITAADGGEVQVGITSYGNAVGCASATDTDVRVDAFLASFIDPYLDQFEGSCAVDGRCRRGCTPADPDCACLDDGVCDTACPTPAKDPDCASSCGADGVCSKAACPSPDPDCAALGAACGRDEHCAGRRCIVSEQHPTPYCSQPCDGAHACPSGFECGAEGLCHLPVQVVLALGDECGPGVGTCGSAARVCATYGNGTITRCVGRCFADQDCTDGQRCTVNGAGEQEGVCLPTVSLPRVGALSLPAAPGCAAAPGSLGLVVAWAWLLRRRR